MRTAVDREIALSRADGVSNRGNLPFLLESPHPLAKGILLVHGFTATPQEMRPLAEHLHERGDTVFAVRLPGHGTSAADLATRSYQEWVEAVARGHLLLAERGLPVVGIGLSTGALLLLKLAMSEPFSALVLLSPFLQLRHRLAPLAGLLRYWMPYQKRELKPAEQTRYYTERPLRGVHQINLLRRQIRRELHRVDVPALVLAAEGDTTIAPGTSAELFRRLGSRSKMFHLFGQEVPHVLTTAENPRLQETFARIDAFLAQLPHQRS
ncbi:MAG: alpha/beta fold hydrolase [Desulfuromonadales bacterium]|nr:alpha/beta fold hydrolase [Desulfuromonadales bacterium]